MRPPPAFAERLIAWQRRAGRHDLPWQGTRDPYRVWLSEIMLQQTQVATVRDYYARFLQRFPDVFALAQAPLDDVMALWSGLGYYSRARNLHRCARVVIGDHGGQFPTNALALQELPGIGASTAAAIAAFCFGERVSIADGNVRRVLTRLLAYGEDLAQTKAVRELEQLAQALLPDAPSAPDMVAYTQGLMDLGATVCTRARPLCGECPMQDICRGHALGEVGRFPLKTRKTARRFERWWLLLQVHAGQVWLERRPSNGIWAQLYAPPVHGSEAALLASLAPGTQATPGEPVKHALTHRELQLLPWWVHSPEVPVTTGTGGAWVPLSKALALGLPAPVRLLLQPLADQPLPQ
ncbi:MAG: A/G-specific adenine glycosylase [Hydrogenophaga sp.]|uniref:A/G-specific adenine glycosylase n=1 Tax=Hydrogenophaga sp. TaxID=1904254 RepID=UPI001D2B60C6|nr:A/G-specific adenine glycosylase [Hydrogenophaga sp.]MBX3610766.1 A/G-specific adenine glycosylase [Hydrogenophaga sp.]